MASHKRARGLQTLALLDECVATTIITVICNDDSRGNCAVDTVILMKGFDQLPSL